MSLLKKIETVAVDSLELYPGNAKKGDVDSIEESLKENDQFSPIVVQKSTGYVLAGNHTLLAARKAGWPTIDVVMIDVDDKRALKINLAANRTADRGNYDVDARAALLELLEGDYAGTGYSEAEVEKFTHFAEDLPEPGDAETEDFDHVWGVIVTCESEADQVRLLRRFSEEGLSVRSLMT